MKYSRKSPGFSLPELLVASAVSAGLTVICLTSFVGLQRFQAVCLARSGLRTEIVRLFDAMEVDLRCAKTINTAVAGNESILPVTLTFPQRYSAYMPTGNVSGEPGRSAARIQPSLNPTTGRLVFPGDITVRYDSVPNGANALDITRTVTWTEAGAVQTATRVISTVPRNATVRFRSSTSTSASPLPIAANDIALVATVNSPLSSQRLAAAAPTTIESTIFLRRKSLK